MVSRNLLAAFMEEEAAPPSSKRRAWDDEFVLKRQFSALIPAFDPRPGRTNINQVSKFLFSLFSTVIDFKAKVFLMLFSTKVEVSFSRI